MERCLKVLFTDILLERVFDSECSHTMISKNDYNRFLLSYDMLWSQKRKSFGIHYCGTDPHRFADSFEQIPNLDFLDVGWGGDIEKLRSLLPNTFLNIRLSPIELIQASEEQIRQSIIDSINNSGNIGLTGICCINIDDKVPDCNITAILEAVQEIRENQVFIK
jgi:hypothetical protein